jgi:tetratricopeptide (TPR) repeat protein
MPAQTPLKPLLDIGDAINLVAPHNVLAMFSKGGFSITPAMGRQPTMYEEMQIVRPSRRAVVASQSTAPVQKPVEPLNVFDELLKIAPHNVLASLFRGGQLDTIPKGDTLKTFVKTGSGYKFGLPTGSAVKIPAQAAAVTNNIIYLDSYGNTVTIENSDRELVTVQTSSEVRYTTYSGLDITAIVKAIGGPSKVGETSPWVIVPGGMTYPMAKGDSKTFPIVERTVVTGGVSYPILSTPVGKKWKKVGSYYGVDVNGEVQYRMVIILTGAMPKAVPPPTPGPPPTPEDLTTLRAQYLKDIDGWITAAGVMKGNNHADIITGNQYVENIQDALGGLNQTNITGGAPPSPMTLFKGSALPFIPLFIGGFLPFPFPMMRGGQAGELTSQVSQLQTYLNQAKTLNSKVGDDSRSVDNTYNDLVGYRSAVSSATTKSDMTTNYNNAKSANNDIVNFTNRIHTNVTDPYDGMAYYNNSAKSVYSSAYNVIVPPSGAPSVYTTSAIKAQADALWDAAGTALNQGNYDDAASKYTQAASLYTQAGDSASAVDSTTRAANALKLKGTMASRIQTTQVTKLINTAKGLEASGQFLDAANAYDNVAQSYQNAGDTVNAKKARDQASALRTKAQAQSTAETAQRTLMQQQTTLDAQATQLERSGDYEGAAKIYDQLYALTGNSNYQVFAANRRKTAAQQAQLKGSQSQASAVSQAAAEYRQRMKRLTGG